MDYDLGYFDLEARVLASTRKSIRPKSVTHVTGTLCHPCLRAGTMICWWALQDLNLGPTDYESAALTAELRARNRNDHSAAGIAG